MRPLKSHASYCLYRKLTKAGYLWYVRFWDETARRYSCIRSTGILVKGRGEGRHDAEEAARAILPSVFTPAAPEIPEKSFVQYVADFWLPDSPYVREHAQVKQKPHSAKYLKIHRDDIRLHIATFPGFLDIPLHHLTPGLIRDWMTWAAEKGLKGGRINKVLEAIRVPVRYLFSREELDRDPFLNIGKAPDIRKEKGVLTPAEVSALTHAPAKDLRVRLAVLLGMRCGLRLGEVRGLLWGDIGDGVINVCHNWVDEDGLKAPKLGSSGTVPLLKSVQAAINVVRKLSPNTEPGAFVMESLTCPGKPLGKSYFEDGLARDLGTIGIPGKWKPAPHQGKKLKPEEIVSPEGYINEQKRRNLTFHGLRHTFITLGRLAGLSDFEI